MGQDYTLPTGGNALRLRSLRFATSVIYDWKNTLTLRWASSHLGTEEENSLVAVARDCLTSQLTTRVRLSFCPNSSRLRHRVTTVDPLIFSAVFPATPSSPDYSSCRTHPSPHAIPAISFHSAGTGNGSSSSPSPTSACLVCLCGATPVRTPRAERFPSER